jgi:hypothetical protein
MDGESDLTKMTRVNQYFGDPKTTYDEFDMSLGRDRIFVVYPLDELVQKIPADSEIDVDAQIEVIKWLQGQTTNEFVIAWLVDKRGIVQRAGGVKS